MGSIRASRRRRTTKGTKALEKRERGMARRCSVLLRCTAPGKASVSDLGPSEDKTLRTYPKNARSNTICAQAN